MPSTFTNNLGVEKPGSGEKSGTWGDVVNVNMDIVDRAVNGAASLTLAGATSTLTTTDGMLSDGQNKFLRLTGSPGGTHTITVAPNDAQKIYFVTNGTNQSVVFSQGSGANITVLAGDNAVVYCNGAGAGAAVSSVLPVASPFATYGGTANAITLTTGLSLASIADRQQIRFRATATNSGATTINVDGIGAVTCNSLKGGALPAGYIRTGVDTIATRVGAVWIVDRAPEAGSNANGDFERRADGAIVLRHVPTLTGLSVAAGATYLSDVYTFPAVILPAELFLSYTGYVTDAGGNRYSIVILAEGGSTWRFSFLNTSAVTITRVLALRLFASGSWY